MVSRSTAESVFDASAFERSLDRRLPTRWIGWRLRALVVAALLGCLGVFWLMRAVALSPYVDASWVLNDRGQLLLAGSSHGALSGLAGRTLLSATGADGRPIVLDATVLQRSPRWQPDDALRERQALTQRRLAAALETGRVTLQWTDGSSTVVAAQPRGYSGLGLWFWPLAAFALLLYLVGIVVLLVRPQTRNLLYFVIALSQAAQVMLIAIDSARGIGLPGFALSIGTAPRLLLDLVSAAAALHAFTLHPLTLPWAGRVSAASWAMVALFTAITAGVALPGVWWWGQALVLVLGLGTIGVLTQSYKIEPNPFAAVMRRLTLIAVGTFALISLAVAVSSSRAEIQGAALTVGTVLWTLFFASQLLLLPFLSRSKQVLREFAMLAGISTVAASFDLLFVAVFSLGAFTSLTLAVFVALGVYAAVRQWMLNQLMGSTVLTTERTFEQLYRVAREVQERPHRYMPLLTQLLRDLFEPLEVLRVDRSAALARVVGGGSALLVPVRQAAGNEDDIGTPTLLLLRFARRGQRLFTEDDARLADRVVEQLRRAVAYDKAVERGRSEERHRIAQDLHDDIGARLLTLMYKAPSPEVEEYIRHTLQDLKTLTRGLAASEHRLSHAAAEWKSDLTQRLTAAHVELGWSFSFDRDVRLTVVQWSALTRVLRELISNTLYHAKATRVDVSFTLHGTVLSLQVADDGLGTAPQGWSHGLGLGGVRKRVKLLGGEVRWRERPPRGIVCEVRVPEFVAQE